MTSAQASTVLQHVRRLGPAGTTSEPPDAQLLARFVKSRDEAAFSALVRRYAPMVLNVCRTVLRHEQDAEDALQATFIVLARKANSIRQREALAGWLYEVAHRVATRAQASAARRREQERKATPMPPACPAVAPTGRRSSPRKKTAGTHWSLTSESSDVAAAPSLSDRNFRESPIPFS